MVIKKTVKKKKKATRKPRGKLADIQLPATIGERISFSPSGRRSFKTENELRKLILEYFLHQKENRRPLLWIGIAAFCGLSRDTLHQYESGIYDYEHNKYSDTLREAKSFIENEKLENTLLGYYNSNIAKFDLANNHGYTEKQDINAKVQQKQIDPDKDFVDVDRAARAYEALLKD